jgi:hypothetical protein
LHHEKSLKIENRQMKNLSNKISLCLLAVAFLFLLTAKANAQKANEYAPKKVEAGIRFLPSFATFKMRTSTGSEVNGQAVTGYTAGTFMSFNFTKLMGIQFEINYSSYARKMKESDITHTINLQYIEIPLLVSFNSGKIRMINVNCVVGPQIGLNVGSKINTTGGESVVGLPPMLKIRQSSLGLAYGAGIDFGLNYKRTIRLGLGYRGVVGLINISNNREVPPADTYYIMERTPLNTYSAYISLSFLL